LPPGDFVKLSRTAVGVLAIGLFAGAAQAQLAGAALGAAFQRDASSGWRSTTRFDPAGRLDLRWASVRGDLSAAAGGAGWKLQGAEASTLFSPPPLGPFRFSAEARLEHVPTGNGALRVAEGVDGALSFAARNSGAWLGLGAERSALLDSAGPRALLRAGAWRQFGSVIISVTSAEHALRLGGRSQLPEQVYPGVSQDSVLDSLTHTYIPVTRQTSTVVTDSGAPSRLVKWTDFETRFGWSGSRLTLDARVGLRPAFSSQRSAVWASTSSTLQISNHLSLVANVGSEAARLQVGAPPGRFVTLGLRVAPPGLVREAVSPHIRPTASNFFVDRVDSASYVVSVRVPNARIVELSGDFNRWQPIALHQTRPDVWEAPIDVAPGTYRVNLRVNGDRWAAPPGLAAVDDEFNGTVGILVIHK
jgi:hypothetical protein